MPSTPNRGLPYPTLSDAPNGPAEIQDLAEALDLFLSGMQGTHASRPAATSHPFTIYYETDTKEWFWSDGTTWQPNLPIPSSVATAMLVDAAVTSRKLKPTGGIIHGTGADVVGSTSSYVDIPGATIAITPEVSSVLYVTAVFTLDMPGGSNSGELALTVDGTRQSPELDSKQMGMEIGDTVSGSWSGQWAVPLSASAHTIKLQGAFRGATLRTTRTSFSYLLVAS